MASETYDAYRKGEYWTAGGLGLGTGISAIPGGGPLMRLGRGGLKWLRRGAPATEAVAAKAPTLLSRLANVGKGVGRSAVHVADVATPILGGQFAEGVNDELKDRAKEQEEANTVQQPEEPKQIPASESIKIHLANIARLRKLIDARKAALAQRNNQNIPIQKQEVAQAPKEERQTVTLPASESIKIHLANIARLRKLIDARKAALAQRNNQNIQQ
jgi:hypothetical protein